MADTKSTRHIALDDSRGGSFAPGQAEALDLIHVLAAEVGPRRPCSTAERKAASRLVAWLQSRRVEARIEEIRGYSTFALPYALLFSASLGGGLLQRFRRRGVRR